MTITYNKAIYDEAKTLSHHKTLNAFNAFRLKHMSTGVSEWPTSASRNEALAALCAAKNERVAALNVFIAKLSVGHADTVHLKRNIWQFLHNPFQIIFFLSSAVLHASQCSLFATKSRSTYP